MTKKYGELVEHYLDLKDTVSLPLKLKMYFCMLQKVTINFYNGPNIAKQFQKMYQLFLCAFKKQPIEQKEYFLLYSLKNAVMVVNQLQNYEITDKVQQIQTTCFIKESYMGIKLWNKTTFKFNKQSRIIKINIRKQKTFLNIQQYYVRKSKKNKNIIVLQTLNQNVSHPLTKIQLQFSDQILLHEVYTIMRDLMIQISLHQMEKLIKDNLYNQSSLLTAHSTLGKTLLILNPKKMNDYFNFRSKILGLKYFSNCECIYQCKSCIIKCDNNNQNFYILQKNTPLSFKQTINRISLLNKKLDGNYLLHYEKLQTYTDKISANYFKFRIYHDVHELLAIVEYIQKKNQLYMVIKSIDNFMTKKTIHYLVIHILSVDGQSKINIWGHMNFNNQKKKKKKNRNQVEFLLRLVNIDSCKEIVELQLKNNLQTQQNQNYDNQQFFTIRQSNSNSQGEKLQQIQGNMLSHNYFTEKRNNNEFTNEKQNNYDNNHHKNDIIIDNNTNSYLTKKFMIQPSLSQGSKILLKKHYLYEDFIRHSKGGMLCCKEQIISEQKKIMKLVLIRLGNSIVKHKNIMNLSFPIQVFKPESNLTSCAKTLIYAPLLFEPVHSRTALQKMQKSVLFLISIGVLSISMQKPFNPILGETYQGFIDDCPVYMEQISHHPPISAYLMYGRGYRIEGCIETKISLGLNCGKGRSERLNRIIFDDGDTIEFSLFKVVAGGLIFGQRTFIFQGTYYLIDEKNNLICEIIFGNMSGYFSYSYNHPNDYVNGSIYKINQQFMKNFIKNGRKSFNKQDGKLLSSFTGIWSQSIQFDGQTVIDFEHQLPPPLLHQLHPLMSDSQKRIDLRYLAKNMKKQAQDKKDCLEQEQRTDKKLRNKNL